MNKSLLVSFKLLVFGIMSWFIVSQLFMKNDFKSQWHYCFEHLSGGRFYLLIAVVLLMPLNWGLETLKWKMLLRTQIPLGRLLQSVIAGITVGFVTPGRSGEFVGRVMFLNDNNGARVFYLSSVGGLAQTAASLLVGIPFIQIWKNDIFYTEIVTGAALAYLFLFFRFDLMNRFISARPFLQKYGLVINNDQLPDINTQCGVLFFSVVRFGVYLLQYVLLLSFFGIDADFITVTSNSVVYLLAQTFSPLMPLLDFSYRGATALFIFRGITANNIAVLTSVMLIWLLNLVIPAITGYLFILRRRDIRLPWTQGPQIF